MNCGIWITLALFIGLFLGVLVNSICVMAGRGRNYDED